MDNNYPPDDQPTRRRPPDDQPTRRRRRADQPTRRQAPLDPDQRRVPTRARRVPGDLLKPSRPGAAEEAARQAAQRAAQYPPSPPPPPEPHYPPPPEPQGGGLAVPWWVFLIVILAVAGITCGLWGLVLTNRGDASTVLGPTPTPIFVVITSTPTLPPAGEVGETGTPGGETGPGAAGESATATPTPEPATETPAVVSGATVIIVGTEGDGLNVRQGPGVSFDPVCLARDGDQFTVGEGPRDGDGFTWWEVTQVDNPDCFGWAVEPFLEVVLP
jgi:hypothetical protein